MENDINSYTIDGTTLRCVGWTEGDGSGHEGYNVADYFVGGKFLGPDEHGIAPIMEAEQVRPGFYGTPEETFYVTVDGDIWLVQSPDGGAEKISRSALPPGIERVPEILCGNLELPEEITGKKGDVIRASGIAENADYVREWLNSCAAVTGWMECGDYIEFEFDALDAQVVVTRVPDGIWFDVTHAPPGVREVTKQGAESVLAEHEDAKATGIPYEEDSERIEAAGWDHYPPSRKQVARAKRRLARGAK